MKKKILFGLLCLMSVTTLVNAEEKNEQKAPWNTILKDGVLHIEGNMPTSELGEGYKKEIYDLINTQYKEEIEEAGTIKGGENHISVIKCYDEFGTCELSYINNDKEGTGIEVPVIAQVIWHEEKYSEEFQKVAPNGVFTAKSIKPTNNAELYYYVYLHFAKNADSPVLDGVLGECNSDYSKCNLTLYIGKDADSSVEETHTVNVVWQEEDSKVKSAVEGIIQKINGLENNTFLLKDLNLINLFAHFNRDSYFTSINYSSDFQKVVGNSNISYYYMPGAGWGTPFESGMEGDIILSYNDITYGIVGSSLVYQNIIYIPEETENTSAAYIAAAKKKIDAYLGNTDTKIEVNQKISEGDFEEDYLLGLGDVSKMGDYYYTVTIGNDKYDFLIIRDSRKTETPVIEKTDIKTNISVSTESTKLPLDTVLRVEELEKNSAFFQEVVADLLKVKDNEEVQVYDLTLFSESLNSNITKLETGEFKVTVPIKESLKGKKLAAYYITEENKIEVHPITEKDGMATFTTTHFSVYTIAEVRNIDSSLLVSVPKTYDGIMSSVMLGIVGLAGLTTAVIVLKKREN